MREESKKVPLYQRMTEQNSSLECFPKSVFLLHRIWVGVGYMKDACTGVLQNQPGPALTDAIPPHIETRGQAKREGFVCASVAACPVRNNSNRLLEPEQLSQSVRSWLNSFQKSLLFIESDTNKSYIKLAGGIHEMDIYPPFSTMGHPLFFNPRTDHLGFHA